MRDHYLRAIVEMARQDDSIVFVTGDVGFGVLETFANEFPTRFFNAGVAEQNMTALAAGLALEGLKVFTYTIANFATLRCLEQIRNDVCYHELDVTILSVGGGFSYGQLGMSHFATEDLSVMRALPGMRVVAPADPWEAELLAWQLWRSPGPAYVRIDKGQAGLDPTEVRLGEARVVREGSDVTLMGIGSILSDAMQAAQQLGQQGVSARVVAFNSVKPLDVEAVIAAARETGGIVTVEEHTVVGGFGSAVAEAFSDAGAFPKVFHRVGLRDTFPTTVGDQRFLRTEYNMDAMSIVSQTLDALRSS